MFLRSISTFTFQDLSENVRVSYVLIIITPLAAKNCNKLKIAKFSFSPLGAPQLSEMLFKTNRPKVYSKTFPTMYRFPMSESNFEKLGGAPT